MKKGYRLFLICVVGLMIIALYTCKAYNSYEEKVENVVAPLDTGGVLVISSDSLIEELDELAILLEARVEHDVDTLETAIMDIIANRKQLVTQLRNTKNTVVYDTIKVVKYIPVVPDSMTVHNVIETIKYDSVGLTYVKTDTIQSRVVSREYYQKYLIDSPYWKNN
jgi:hypothetical protein